MNRKQCGDLFSKAILLIDTAASHTFRITYNLSKQNYLNSGDISSIFLQEINELQLQVFGKAEIKIFLEILFVQFYARH